MNLLDKNWHGLLILAALAIFSCEDPNDIGLGLDPDGINVSVLYTELPLEASNVRLDSIRTDGDSRLLIGKHNSSIFGEMESQTFCGLTYTNNLLSDDKFLDDQNEGKQVYFVDSAILYLQISKVQNGRIHKIYLLSFILVIQELVIRK